LLIVTKTTPVRSATSRMTGIVDVDDDVVCSGDPLYTPALTTVALVPSDQLTDYVDAWLEAWWDRRSGLRS